MKILVTGGTGYIGSHTIVDLQQHGFEVICADNLSCSKIDVLNNIKDITDIKPVNYTVDVANYAATKQIFLQHPDIKGVIHFAAYKAVGESVAEPLLYYQNNIGCLLNILALIQEFNVSNFVFSSSCTVYGTPDETPVTEESPLKNPTSPYGATKQFGEQMVRDFCIANPAVNSILLRYFNPVGAHPSNLIGELPLGKPQNLVPAITQFAIGKIDSLHVFGTDYNTRDGSCVRDYIHVCDIATAHTLALEYLINRCNQQQCEVFNLGTGQGVTVLEAIKAFEKVNSIKLNYTLTNRRSGDVEAIYANCNLAKEKLGWAPKFKLDDMMRTAWLWEQKINA